MPKTICEGLTVLECGGTMANALAGMLLADNGARVLKVEPPGGDPVRREHPSGFLVWNRGKESVALDLHTTQGQQEAQQLAQSVDVLVEAFDTGVAERCGLGYEALRKLNPALVYCSIKGFASKGPYAHIKGDHGIVAAKSGAFLQAGFRPGPMYIAAQSTYNGAAQMAVQGILAALMVRQQTGKGQYLETSLYQGHNPADYFGMISYQMYQRDPAKYAPRTQRSGRGAIATVYCTKDNKWLTWTLQLPHQQMAAFRALGLDWIYGDPRFADYPQFANPEDAEEFQNMVMTRFRERTLEEWMQVFLADPDIPFEVVVSSEEALSHPQIIHNKDWVLIDDPTVGPMKQVGPIGHFSETPSVIGNPAPALGQHNPLPHPTKNRSSADGTGKAPPPHPLHGVSIVECGYFYAMPFGVTLAASLGARVFKIEPIEGDPMRFGFNFPEAGAVKTMEGKESIPIDMKTPEGQKIIHQLVAKADVFVTSFRPGVPERLKVDYQTLRKINPRLVYVHATGYGTTGPYSHRPTYAGTASAAAGQLARQARYWLDPKQAEDRNLAGLKELASRVRALVDGDANGALGVATATALAIFHQRRTGQGQFVATTQVGGNLYAYSDDFTSYKGKAPVPVPDPDYYGLHALYRLYQAQRGWVFLACTSQEEWERFCSLTGQEGLLHDPRFATPLARKQHDHELIASLIALFAQRPADEWENHLAPRGVGCVRVFEPPSGGLVNWYPEFSCTDPALKEMGLVAEVEHPLFGRIVRHGLPVIFSETPGRIAPGCMIGQHTEAILMELGYTSEQIQQLIQQRVVTSVAKGVPTQQR